MIDNEESSNIETLKAEIEAKQRNTVWPDALRNSKSVDEYLWKGDPEAPLVQRMGAWFFGITFMLIGVGLIEADREASPDRKSLIPVIMAVFAFMLGIRLFFNGFRKRKKKIPPSE